MKYKHTIEGGESYVREKHDTRFDNEVEEDLVFLVQNIGKMSLKTKESITRLAKSIK